MPYGSQIKFGVARQATVGSWATAAGSYHAIALLSEDIGLSREELISENLTGRFEQGATYDGVATVDGTIEVEATPRNLLALCGMTLTHSPTTVNSGSIRTWTFLPSTTDFSATLVKAPFSIYKQFTDSNSAFLFYDVQATQIEFSFSQGQFSRVRATLAGGTNLPNGIGSLSIVPDVQDAGRLWPWNVTSISLGGTAMPQFSDITISLNESIEPLYTVNGTLAPYKYTRTGFREVTVSGTMMFDTRSVHNDFVAGTHRRLLITAASTISAIQSGYFNTMIIDVPHMKITESKPSASGPGEVTVSFTGRGLTEPTSFYTFQATLINSWQTDL